MLLLNYLFLEFIIAILVRLLFQKLEELFKLSGIRIEKNKTFSNSQICMEDPVDGRDTSRISNCSEIIKVEAERIQSKKLKGKNDPQINFKSQYSILRHI